MPKGFSKQEKASIRKSLLDAGAAMLRTHSVSKISVEDMTRAAHISKGAFYQFFPSKEELFVTLFAEAELAFRDQLRELAKRPARTPKARMLAFMRDSLHHYRTLPLFSRLSSDDLNTVMRWVSYADVSNTAVPAGELDFASLA